MLFTRKRTVAVTNIALSAIIAVIILFAGGISLKTAASNTSAQVASAVKVSVESVADVSNFQKLSVDQTPVMGWSGWSFLRIGANTSEIRGEALALISTGLASVGYEYINIDDGWYQCPGPQGPNVDQYGRWIINASNYPNTGSENGIKALASYVHSLGLKFGIYETAGISEQAVAENTPVLGTSFTADEIATNRPQNNYNCGGMVDLDYNVPGAQDFVNSIVDELASWGVDYIKLDGITNMNVPDIAAWSAAIVQSGRPMVLDTTQGSFTIKIAPELKHYSNQWEFAPDIEINGPDEGSANRLQLSSFYRMSQCIPADQLLPLEGQVQ